MSYYERNTWAFGAIALVAYGAYLAVVIPRLTGTPVVDVDYAVPLFVSIGAAIVAGIVVGIVLGFGPGREETREDERDRSISRFGDHVGNSFVVIGGVAAMLLAVARVDGFWIANAVYLCFVLAAVLSSVAKIVAYRRGLPTW